MTRNRKSVTSSLVAALTFGVALFQSGSVLGSIAAVQGEIPLSNTTLDTEYGDNANWKIPYSFSKWFEYYNNSADFKNYTGINTTCAHNFTDWDNLLSVEANGVWVACHDDGLPEECATQTSSPCHPAMGYKDPWDYDYGMRTVKINFAIYGLAILRVNFPNIGECVDYSLRKDPFSSCVFMKQEPLPNKEAWRRVRFTFDPIQNISFQFFTIELIARFKNDFVLVDKVEATPYLLCSGSEPEEEIVCPSPPTTTIPTTTYFTTTTTLSTSELTTRQTDSTTTSLSTTMQSTTEFTTQETDSTTQTTEATTQTTTEVTSEETEATTQTTEVTTQTTEATTQTTEITSEETEATTQTTEVTSEETELSTTESSTKVTETTEQPNNPTTPSSSTQVYSQSITIFTTALLIIVLI